MDDLIEALQIFKEYLYLPNDPTNMRCEHETLIVEYGTEESDVSQEHIKKLNELGFFWDESHEAWCMYM